MANSHTLVFLSLLLLSVIVIATTTLKEEEEEKDSPVTRFQGYLRINTAHPNPDYAGAASYLLSQAERAGLTARVLEFAPSKPLVLLTWQGTRPELPSVLLNSHIDSVPAEAAKWAHPPFSAHRTPDGRIFARGAQDDKCLALQQIEAAANLRRRGFRPLRTLHVSVVPDEEIGAFDGFALFAESDELRALNVGFSLDEGQANPGEEFRVFYADRCPWELKITARGPPGHGSTMFDTSAADNLMKSVEMISRFRDAQFDVVKAGLAANSEVTSVNMVYLNAGTPSPDGFVMNVQPSEAEAEAGFDVRLPPTADPDFVRRRIAEEWAPAIRNMTYTIREKGPTRDIHGRPVMTPTNSSNPWWAVFNKAITAVGGKLAKPEMLASTSDARFLRRLGIPVLGFSPMINTPILIHDHNEFLKDTVYLRGIEVYESIISALLSFEEEASH